MPSAKTEATELSMGFGILGFDNPIGRIDQILALFDGTLSSEVYTSFEVEYQRNVALYSRFVVIGLGLRERNFDNITSINWTGPDQQANTVSGANDLYIPRVNTPISVKCNSNVVANRSPYNFFVSLPSGMVTVSRSNDWFIEKDYDGIQAFYEHARQSYGERIPEDIRDFYQSYTRERRRPFSQFVKHSMEDVRDEELINLYQIMCHNVARNSADDFNHHLASIRPNTRIAINETIVREFFRIDTVPYLLAGLDHGNSLAVMIPDLTSWKRNWGLLSATAVPALDKMQSEVNVTLTFMEKLRRMSFTLPFRAEIRWSHGKFCGNPESKIYKDFSWLDVPFFENC